jgi:hypothetical protein
VIVNPLMREHPWSAGDAVCRGGMVWSVSVAFGESISPSARRRRRPRALDPSAAATGFRLSLTFAFNIGDEESK